MNQDFVHHCTEQVYLEINNLYRRFRSRIEHVHLWSDNCASQFKCCHTFGWASKFRQTHKLFSLVSFFGKFVFCTHITIANLKVTNTTLIYMHACNPSIFITLLPNMGRVYVMVRQQL